MTFSSFIFFSKVCFHTPCGWSSPDSLAWPAELLWGEPFPLQGWAAKLLLAHDPLPWCWRSEYPGSACTHHTETHTHTSTHKGGPTWHVSRKQLSVWKTLDRQQLCSLNISQRQEQGGGGSDRNSKCSITAQGDLQFPTSKASPASASLCG